MHKLKPLLGSLTVLFAISIQPAVCQTAREAAGKAAQQQRNTFQNVPVELSFTADASYPDPIYAVDVDVIVTAPDGAIQRVPAFWDGGKTWKARYASPVAGRYSWRIECSNKDDKSLNDKRGIINIQQYKGAASLYRAGPVRMAADHRHFEYADGEPFLWFGDTWWKGLSKRIDLAGFKTLTADRKAKGFNLIQLIVGPYPDEPAFDPRWANEGGMPYAKNYTAINPAYFHYADLRISHLAEQGMVPAIVGGWGWHMEKVGLEKMKRHWRYLIARYGAYPVIWIAGGEAGGDEWTAVAGYIQKADPFQRLVTMHSFPGSGRMYVSDENVLDFDMLQTGHGGVFGYGSPYGVWQATAANTVAKVMTAYSKTPAMPVILGEVTYEGHMRTNNAEVQRQVFWSSILSGAAGFTYGAGGIWQMNSATERGAEYEFTPWFEAMHLPGSSQLGAGKKLLEQYRWWKFEPHPDWVEPHSSSLYEPHEKWYDDSAKFAEDGGHWDRPFAAGIPGEVRVVYMPGHYYDWTSPTIKKLEAGIPYHAFLVDPASAKKYELGIIVYASDTIQQKAYNDLAARQGKQHKYETLIMHENPGIVPDTTIPPLTILRSDEYKMPRLPAPQDWLLVMERIKE